HIHGALSTFARALSSPHFLTSSCLLLLPRPPRPTLFPYTTLFRSSAHTEKDYDLFERSKDQSLVWHGCVHGLENARRKLQQLARDRKSTRLNSSHVAISYAVFCLKKKSVRPKRCCVSPTAVAATCT